MQPRERRSHLVVVTDNSAARDRRERRVGEVKRYARCGKRVLALWPSSVCLRRIGWCKDYCAPCTANRRRNEIEARDERRGAVRHRLARMIRPHVDDDQRSGIPSQRSRSAPRAVALDQGEGRSRGGRVGAA